MNQSKKVLKKEPNTEKKNRWRWLKKLRECQKKFGEWWRNRSEWQKRWMCCFVCVFVIALPFTSFLTRTYLAMWELNRNSNLIYRLGQSLSEEELREKFELHPEKKDAWDWYTLKEKEENVSRVIYSTYYPFDIVPIGHRIVTNLKTSGNEYYVLGIENGMDLKRAESQLRKRGYKELKSLDAGKKYYKAGLIIYIGQKDEKVEYLSFGIEEFFMFINDTLPDRIKGK